MAKITKKSASAAKKQGKTSGKSSASKSIQKKGETSKSKATIKNKKSQKMAQRKIPITFITGNAKKLEEFMSIMTGELTEAYQVSNMGMDLEEI